MGGLATVIPGLLAAFTGGGSAPQVGGAGQTSTQQTGTQSTQRVLTPQQQQLQGPLFSYIQNLMTNPDAAVAPIRTQARNQVNANYAGAGDALRQKFLATGGGSSGKYGLALAGSENQRLGDLDAADQNVIAQELGLQTTAAGLGTALLGQNNGTTSTGGSSSSQQSVSVPVDNSSSLQQVLNALRSAGINVGDVGQGAMGGEEIGDE